MKTLSKVLLLVFWLLGAGIGWSSPADTSSPETPVAYRVALFDGVDLKVHHDRVTVNVVSPWSDDRVALAASVPQWVTALSAQVHASSSARPAATAASKAPAPSPPGPRGS